jgi:serine/threonine protein kinase
MRLEFRAEDVNVSSPRDELLMANMDLSAEMLEEIYEAAAPRVPLPCQIGPYRLHREIGRGSCGRVYRAVDTALDHPVAVKLLADYANDLSEARKAVAVEHPNVVRVFAAGHYEGVAYIVYEFVDGPRLDQYLVNKPRRTRLRVVRDLAQGIAAAHLKGIVHGDVRPRNILMQGDRPKLADFGLDLMGDAQPRDDVADLAKLAGLSQNPESAESLARAITRRLNWPRRLGVAACVLIAAAGVTWFGVDRQSLAQESDAAAARAESAEDAVDTRDAILYTIGYGVLSAKAFFTGFSAEADQLQQLSPENVPAEDEASETEDGAYLPVEHQIPVLKD